MLLFSRVKEDSQELCATRNWTVEFLQSVMTLATARINVQKRSSRIYRGVPIRCWRFWEQKDVTSSLTTTERPLCALQADRVCAGRLLSSDGRTARSKRGCGDTLHKSRHSTVAVQWAIACDISLSQLAEWNRSQEISHRHAMLRHLWTQLITSEKNIPRSHFHARLYVFDDSEAVIRIATSGRSPTMRLVTTTHRIDLVWLWNALQKHGFKGEQLVDVLTEVLSRCSNGGHSCI